MNLNDFIFLAPEFSSEPNILENVIWIPRNFEQVGKINALIIDLNNKSTPPVKHFEPLRDKYAPPAGGKMKKISITSNEDAIPCLFLPYSEGSDKFLIYFHGNSEDNTGAYQFICDLQDHLKVNVISMEYPGYGLYVGKPSQEKLFGDAEILFDYLQYHIGIPSENIILFGRSMGSGPAIYLASRRNPGVLLLMSAFTSIRDVARGLIGKIGSLLVADVFRNIDEIGGVHCSTFFLHGKSDALVSYQHSVELSKKISGFCVLFLPKTMTHSRYFMDRHITMPITHFLLDCGYQINLGEEVYKLPKELYVQPESLKDKERNFISSCASIIRDCIQNFMNI